VVVGLADWLLHLLFLSVYAYLLGLLLYILILVVLLQLVRWLLSMLVALLLMTWFDGLSGFVLSGSLLSCLSFHVVIGLVSRMLR